ncbi:DNA-directed RNA polymerase subunit omega [Candidatus Omnitrophota bacterium]
MKNNQHQQNKVLGDFDYEKQSFEDLDINPYEVVVAVAKKAREINEKAQKYLSNEYEIHPANIALKKIETEEIEFSYEDEQPKPSEDATKED